MMATARRAVPVSRLVVRADRSAFAFILAAVLVEMVFFIVLGPLLPHYASTLHMSKLGAGLLSASYAAGCGLAAIPAGLVTGALGARGVTIGGLLLVGVACGGFALADSAATLDAARIVQGVGAAAVWSGAIAWLMAIGGEGDRGRLIGLAFSAAGVGACVGPAVGAIAQIAGPRSVFLVLSAVILTLAAMGLAIARRTPAPRSDRRDGAGMRTALLDGGTRRALLVVALPSIGYGVVGVLVPLRLHALGATAATIAGAYIAAALLETVASPLVGGFYDRRGATVVLRATLVAAVVSALAFAVQPPLLLLLLTLAVSGPVIGAVWVPALGELMSAAERVGAGAGIALGLFNLCWAATQTFAAVGGAQLARSSEAAPFVVLATLYALAGLSARALSRP
jgi:predicted MFS family arabinose efflux permease